MNKIAVNNKLLSIKSIFYDWRNYVRLFLAQYPQIYLIFQSWLFGFTDSHLLQQDTDIVIEGFPCCANSFAVKAFQIAQKEQAQIAHHTHDPSQIVAAIHANIPTIVLIRDPKDAVISFIIRFLDENKHDLKNSVKKKLEEYIYFYTEILPYKDKFILAEFTEITNDFGSIILKVNYKFNTSFDKFVHNQKNVERCFDLIEQYNKNKSIKNQISEKSVARPSEYRQNAKNKLQYYFQNSEIKELNYKATKIYQSLIN